ncbi:MAG: nucleoside triphosphate pyrophosphohydrolase [Candidatus Aminicenantales bacterium]
MKSSGNSGREFQKLVTIMGTLRSPEGCPWDRRQDVRSIVDYFLEEAYEAAEACLSGGPDAAAEELGDILMEIVLLAQIFEERGRFSVTDALRRINRKMVDRHPHVFGGPKAKGARQIVDEWQRRKLREKDRASVLDGLGGNVPALLGAFQIGQRVSACGFDWPDVSGALEKVREEVGELEEAVSSSKRKAVEEELGDLLFALCNVARHVKVNPEIALRRANRKFTGRFKKVEQRLREKGRGPAASTLREMDGIWEDVKGRSR